MRGLHHPILHRPRMRDNNFNRRADRDLDHDSASTEEGENSYNVELESLGATRWALNIGLTYVPAW